MAACEKCWSDAFVRMMRLGGSQTDHYGQLIKEREGNPCSEVEQQEGSDSFTLLGSTYFEGGTPRHD